MTPTRDQLIALILRETTDKVTADCVQIGAPNILEVGCRYVRGDPKRGYENPAEAARQFAGFIADAVLACNRAQAQDEGAAGEASAYRVRMISDDPAEWVLMHPEKALDFLSRKGWESQPLYAHPSPAPAADGVVEQYHARQIAEVMDEGDGFWKPCSGCQEGVDGYVSEKDYPFNRVFRCQPGGGCSECGGLGVLWDDTDYDAMATAMLADVETESNDEPPAADEGMVRIAVEKLESIRMMRSDRPSGPYPKSYKGGFDAAADLMSGWATEALAALKGEVPL